jgi:hypothetical protein
VLLMMSRVVKTRAFLDRLAYAVASGLGLEAHLSENIAVFLTLCKGGGRAYLARLPSRRGGMSAPAPAKVIRPGFAISKPPRVG